MLALVTIGVFGLFHPTELEVRPAHGGAIVIERGGVRETLEGAHASRIRTAARVAARDGGPAEFILSVPGRIQREFHGRLNVRQFDVRRNSVELLAIVEMDRETAVASIVGAELSASTPIEALKAQAVAARSFLAASHHRHEDFDFCDTTHCQFLREPPSPGSPAARAAEETRGLTVAYQGRVIAALYSADCGGHTRALADAEWKSGEPDRPLGPDDYPYFAVECPRRKPGLVSGPIAGHGVGLCQAGAAEMARTGATFREILNRFYPATTLVRAE
ncbi:MAG TPA: SpoIID/LytB domain-containing protein [Bryobacteraceae bacterium]|nr:SpoIID/LytB domain-containing protein [Bryobacteraceae bacterium]